MTREQLVEKAYALGINDFTVVKHTTWCSQAEHLVKELKDFCKTQKVKLYEVDVEHGPQSNSFRFVAEKEKTAKELREEIVIAEEKEYEKFLELKEKYCPEGCEIFSSCVKKEEE